MRILVADDETGLTDILTAALVRKGHSVDVAHDGLKALELVDRNTYDLAFLDFTMPEMTGVEVMEEMKKRGLPTKTVLITAYTLIEESFAKAAGIDEYLPKPIRLADIERILVKYQR